MSRKHPTFNPGYYTIQELESWGIRIHSVKQYGRWAVLETEGQFQTMQSSPRGMKSPYNTYNDHVSIHSVTIKIRMN